MRLAADRGEVLDVRQPVGFGARKERVRAGKVMTTSYRLFTHERL